MTARKDQPVTQTEQVAVGQELPANLPKFCIESMRAQLATFGVEPACNIEGALAVLASTRPISNEAKVDKLRKAIGEIVAAIQRGDDAEAEAIGIEVLESRYG